MWWHLVSAVVGMGIGIGLLKWRDRSVEAVRGRMGEKVAKLEGALSNEQRKVASYRELEIRADERRAALEEARESGAMTEFEDAYHQNGRAKVTTTAGVISEWRPGR